MNTSIGRVHNLHHCGVGIDAFHNLASNGPANITLAFIFSEISGSMMWLLMFFPLIVMVSSLSHWWVHQSLSRISSIYCTSLVLGTLDIVTSSSVNIAAGISFMILFLLATGVVIPFNGFHPFMISLDIGNLRGKFLAFCIVSSWAKRRILVITKILRLCLRMTGTPSSSSQIPTKLLSKHLMSSGVQSEICLIW